MEVRRDPLFVAYAATSFRAETPDGLVEIRIGKGTPALDRLLHQFGLEEWAYLTAFNPRSVILSPAENQSRQRSLEAEIMRRGLRCFHGEGVGADPSWPPEASVLVLGLSREAALELGRVWGQNAIVVGIRGKPAELVDCTHED